MCKGELEHHFSEVNGISCSSTRSCTDISVSFWAISDKRNRHFTLSMISQKPIEFDSFKAYSKKVSTLCVFSHKGAALCQNFTFL